MMATLAFNELNSEVQYGLNCILVNQLDWKYFINITINLIISLAA